MTRTRGLVSLVFDDGYEEISDRVLPLLATLGIRAVFAVPVDTRAVAASERAPVLSLETWKARCSEGEHELAAHGVTHRALTELSDDDLLRELRESADRTSATTLVYPGGAHDARVRRAAATVFRAARTTDWGFESSPPADPYRLRAVSATRANVSLSKWNLFAIACRLTNRWLIETYHRVTDDAEPRHAVRFPLLEAHLAFLVRHRFRIATIRDVVS